MSQILSNLFNNFRISSALLSNFWRFWLLGLIGSFFFSITGSLASQKSFSSTPKTPQGWLWYGKVQDLPPKEKEPKKENDTSSPQEDPLKRLDKVKREFEVITARAVLEPTLENVQELRAAQKHMINQATHFSNLWVLANLLEASTSLEENSNPQHREILKNQEEQILNLKLKHLSKSWGLFFLFKKGCPYCHRFAPIVKQFADTYGFEVKAISADGGILREFPQAVPDNGAIERLNPEGVFPALFLVNPQNSLVLPLSWGMTSFSDLKANAQILITYMDQNHD